MKLMKSMCIAALLLASATTFAETAPPMIPKAGEWWIGGRKVTATELQQMMRSGQVSGYDASKNVVCVNQGAAGCAWTWPNGRLLSAQEVKQMGLPLSSPPAGSSGNIMGRGDGGLQSALQQATNNIQQQSGPQGKPLPAPMMPGAKAVVPPQHDFFSNWNQKEALGGGRAAFVSFARPVQLTYVAVRHIDDFKRKGAPKTPKIGLLDQNGKMWGPWLATVKLGGMGIRGNLVFEVLPNVMLPPGRYHVIDSEQISWAQNADSKGEGQVVLKGYAYP